MTRAERQSRRFAREVRAAGLTVPILFSPVLEIETVAPMAPVPEGVLIFTSENGVRAAAVLNLLRAGAPAVAVGPRTAWAARAAGLDCHTAGGNVGDIAGLIAREGVPGPFVHLHGCHVTGDLASRLREDGHDATSVTIYDQVPRPLSAAAQAAFERREVLLPLFSPRSAVLVAEALPRRPACTRVVALSKAVAEAWPWDDPVTVASEPRSEALVPELRRLVARSWER